MRTFAGELNPKVKSWFLNAKPAPRHGKKSCCVVVLEKRLNPARALDARGQWRSCGLEAASSTAATSTCSAVGVASCASTDARASGTRFALRKNVTKGFKASLVDPPRRPTTSHENFHANPDTLVPHSSLKPLPIKPTPSETLLAAFFRQSSLPLIAAFAKDFGGPASAANAGGGVEDLAGCDRGPAPASRNRGPANPTSFSTGLFLAAASVDLGTGLAVVFNCIRGH